MVTSCCAYGCTYRHKKGDNIGFFSFPRDPKLLKLWIIAVRRKFWTPSYTSRICGKHFQTGKPSFDESHPDYVPNVFSFNGSENGAAAYEKRMKMLKEISLIKEEQKLKQRNFASTNHNVNIHRITRLDIKRYYID